MYIHIVTFVVLKIRVGKLIQRQAEMKNKLGRKHRCLVHVKFQYDMERCCRHAAY